MKTTVLVAVICLCVFGTNASSGFTNNYDYADILQIPIDKIKGLFECILDKFPCSEEDVAVKRLYPDLVTKACHNCSPDQKHNINTLLNRAEAELPELYQEYKNMFDAVDFEAFRKALIA